MTRLHAYDRSRSFTFSEAPCGARGVKLGLALLLRKCTSEIIKVDAVELGVVGRVLCEGALGEVQDTFVFVFSKLPQVVVQEVLEVWVLLE